MDSAKLIVVCFIAAVVSPGFGDATQYRKLWGKMDPDLNDKIFDVNLIQSSQSLSLQHCTLMCAAFNNCTSLTYNKGSTICRLHGKGFDVENDDDFEDDEGSRYFLITKKGSDDKSECPDGPRGCCPGYKYVEERGTCVQGSVGDRCTKSFDCTIPHSECREEGVCGCVIGYSHLKSNESCVEDCEEYGETFVKFPLQAILLYDTVSIPFVYDPEDCAERCRDAAFVCKSFDMGLITGTCFLQSVDVSEIPASSYTQSTVYDTYQRNCA